MEKYSLQPNESLLYKGECHLVNKNERPLDSLLSTENTELLLTNLNLVFIKKTKKIFAKGQVEVEVYEIENIKIYNEIPQIKQNESRVEIYLKNDEKILDFLSKHEARKFINITYELLTGKSKSARGVEKVKGAVNLVDNTLGIDTVNAVKSVVEKGVAGTILGGFGKKVSNATKSTSTVKEALSITKELLGKKSTVEVAEKSEIKTTLSYGEQLKTIKEMKDLLDAGILTKEEFDAKKKEILGL